MGTPRTDADGSESAPADASPVPAAASGPPSGVNSEADGERRVATLAGSTGSWEGVGPTSPAST
ncbi:MAG TPA: hypothetical protein DCX12_00830 [Chloroflexi bacterium]|nr:hypothetical protein [Chloroflexota bacterium]HBV93329.1 hypothetical protein [Chloroflexota bacterium]